VHRRNLVVKLVVREAGKFMLVDNVKCHCVITTTVHLTRPRSVV
jgi:hypothetical protein